VTATATGAHGGVGGQTFQEVGVALTDPGQAVGRCGRVSAALDLLEDGAGQQVTGHAVDATAGFADQ